jgi:hypothetical protein
MQVLPINLFNRRVNFFNSRLAKRRRIGVAGSCFVRLKGFIGGSLLKNRDPTKFGEPYQAGCNSPQTRGLRPFLRHLSLRQ